MTKASNAGKAAQPGRSVPTIHDVARAAGVTTGTASQALNGRGKMRPETRERVRQAAARLEYRPNHLMQSLLRGRTCTVGLLSTDRYGRFSIPLLEGIEDALDAAQMSVFLCDARDDPAHERRHIDSLLAKQVDGIIVTGRRTTCAPVPGRRRGATRRPPACSTWLPRSTPSSVARICWHAASSTRCASRACACPTTWPWWVSTTGRSSPKARARR